MGRYYFHLRDHCERLLDPHGQEIGDPANIPEIALKQARSLLSHDALAGEIDLRSRIEIEDEDGKIIHILQFEDAIRIIEP